MRLTRSVTVGLGFVAATLIVAPSSNAFENYKHIDTREFDMGSTPHIDIQALSGNASYLGADVAVATVQIIYDIRAKDQFEADAIRERVELTLEGQQGFLELRMDNTRDFYRWLKDEYSREHGVSVSFKVTGPRGAEGIVESVSGNADVGNVAGPIEVSSVSGNTIAVDVTKSVTATSVSGNVEVERVGATVIAESVSGNVAISDCGSDLDVASTSGNVRVVNVKGAVSAETVSGDIDLRGVALGVDAESISGSIWIENLDGDVTAATTSGDIDIASKTDGDIDLESLSGSVSLAVVPGSFGRVTLAANSGDIETDIPITVKRQSRGRLEGTLGNGTALLRVSTSSGDITLSEL